MGESTVVNNDIKKLIFSQHKNSNEKEVWFSKIGKLEKQIKFLEENYV